MSQIGSSKGWFTQLQKHYPMGALVTELVQIHQERFIVKAIVQMGGVTIATSMAESANLETAEGQARLRVLEFLGISAIAQPSNSASPVIAPEPLMPPSDRFPEIALPEISLPETLATSIRQPTENSVSINPLSSLDLETIAPSAPLSLPTVPLPEISADLSMPFPTALFSPEVIPVEPEPAEPKGIPAEEDSPEETVNNFEETVNNFAEVNNFEEEYLPSVEDYGAGDEDEPEDTFPQDSFSQDSFVETEAIATISPTELVPEQPEANFSAPLNLDKPKKGIATENPVANNPVATIEPDDLSTLIAHTDVEMDRIGWTKQEGRDYLKKTYKKSTRQRLDVDELMDFLNYLRALPSVNGI
ncbi:hypothetical protein AB3R30_12775 [Leptolyngbyaceae cyanobacterium UHCC 1019]